MKKNIWLDGMMGLVVGDALGCPVQFLSREDIRRRGFVTGMEGYGTYNMPEGTWTDDSSMALASLDSIIKRKGIDPEDIMRNFVKWEFEGDYTPFGEAFDEGATCTDAIYEFRNHGDYRTCGRTGEYANGNGALMRILPVCLYYIDLYRDKKQDQTKEQPVDIKAFAPDHDPDSQAIQGIHVTSALTHNHLRSQIACGFYYFMAKEIINRLDDADGNGEQDSLRNCLQNGIRAGLAFYGKDKKNQKEMCQYSRLFDLDSFSETPEDEIRSSGYVVDSLEAAVWCLINTDTFAECLLKAVNLGSDTDTVAAIAGGLAGLYYGYESFPDDWLAVIKEREYIEDMCDRCNELQKERV